MDVTPVIERLSDRLPYPVGGAASYAAVQASGAVQPIMVWVVLLHDDAASNQTIGGIHQQIGVTLGVVIRYREVSDALGHAAVRDLQDVRDQVHALLVGWQPVADYRPLTRTRGDLLDVADGAVYWIDSYETDYSLTASLTMVNTPLPGD